MVILKVSSIEQNNNQIKTKANRQTSTQSGASTETSCHTNKQTPTYTTKLTGKQESKRTVTARMEDQPTLDCCTAHAAREDTASRSCPTQGVMAGVWFLEDQAEVADNNKGIG